ncbi:MAG: molybdenum cofactor guanylyltransferase [Proteobacteria bacterium]|nr:molybdenum cofactor guanylyltransferase [Pseudomonadota bacterium]
MPAFDPTLVTAAILAGGEGRRVGGADKGLLEVGGRPLIAHVIAALRPQVGDIVICANRNVDRYAQFAPVVTDGATGFRGPLAGIAAALRGCKSPWLLSVAVDCPQPPRDLAVRLHEAAMNAGRDLAAVFDGDRVQPLFALYRRALAIDAGQALKNDMPVIRWQQDLHRALADFSGRAREFDNLNMLEEFRRWERNAHG